MAAAWEVTGTGTGDWQARESRLWEAPAADTNRDSFLIATFCSFLSVTLHFSSSEGIYVMPSHFSASRRGLSAERELP